MTIERQDVKTDNDAWISVQPGEVLHHADGRKLVVANCDCVKCIEDEPIVINGHELEECTSFHRPFSKSKVNEAFGDGKFEGIDLGFRLRWTPTE